MSVYAVIRANCFDNTKTKLKSLVMYVKYNVYVRIMYYEYLVVCSIEYANGNSKTFNQLTTIRFKLDQFNYSSLLGRSDPNIFVESLITIITNLVPSMAKLKLVQFGFFFPLPFQVHKPCMYLAYGFAFFCQCLYQKLLLLVYFVDDIICDRQLLDSYVNYNTVKRYAVSAQNQT